MHIAPIFIDLPEMLLIKFVQWRIVMFLSMNASRIEPNPL